jgi:hypothetical protein
MRFEASGHFSSTAAGGHFVRRTNVPEETLAGAPEVLEQ